MSGEAKELHNGIFSHLAIARISVECATALSIGSGEMDAVHDMLLIRDADGLPTIPGTALAGVLRHMYERHSKVSNALFGQSRPENRKDDDLGYDASRLFVSWARVHDKANKPAKHNILPKDIQTDEILHWLSQKQPVGRDHVRLGPCGTVDGVGKFERSAVPKGTRFTFELMIEASSEEGAKSDLDAIMHLVTSNYFRLGGGVWRGYGRVEHHDTKYIILDLQNPEGREILGNLQPDLAADLPDDFNTYKIQPEVTWVPTHSYKIAVSPEGFYRFGGGDTALRQNKVAQNGGYEKDVDNFVKTESVIEWPENGVGSKSKPKLLIPASSIKGAIRHRTAFHARCFSEAFSDDENSVSDPDICVSLFGNAKENDVGRAGRVMIDDVYCDVSEKNIGRMSHNAIDRFTQGTIDGALFDEELVWDIGFNIHLSILPSWSDQARTDVLNEDEKRALEATLNDLVSGRLPLGGGASNGHGFFSGTIKPQINMRADNP